MKKFIYLFLFLLSLRPVLNAQDKGYSNFISFSTLIGSEDDKQTFVSSFQMEHNYQFDKNFAFGLLTGFEWFEVNIAPIGPNLKLMLADKDGGIGYIGSSIGYAFALEDVKMEYIETKETKGGRFFSSEAGYIFPSRYGAQFYVALGYRYQTLSFKRDSWRSHATERSISYNRFLLKVGVKLF